MNQAIYSFQTFNSSPSNQPIQASKPTWRNKKEKKDPSIMRSSKKLSEIIGKWRKRRKGHFVVYAKEGKRFVVPLYYLNHPIFRVLLEMAEEEFGLTAHGPLQVPCEEEMMDYIVSLLRKNPPVEVEKAIVSITTCRRPSSYGTMVS